MRLLVWLLLSTSVCASAQYLTVAVAQVDKQPSLAANRDKIIDFVKKAKQQASDLVVFPESFLGCETCVEDPAYGSELMSAIEEIRMAAKENQIYTVFCVQYKPDERNRLDNRLYAINEKGEVAKVYDKIWDHRNVRPPGTISVNGIPIGLTICSDRWLRSTTDLSLLDAPVTIECSWSKPDTVYFPYGPLEGIHWWEIRMDEGKFLDCSPPRGPYWIPRAMRNDVFVLCAGRRAAIVDPDGKAYHCSDKNEQLLVKRIDVVGVRRESAMARFNHPTLKPWWDMGVRMLNGEGTPGKVAEVLVSAPSELIIALAQMKVSQQVETNLKLIEKSMEAASREHADLIVFPALAVTGAMKPGSEIREDTIKKAIHRIRVTAKKLGIYVALGSAWKGKDKWFNSAFVIDDHGEVITRYDQLSADGTTFSPGNSARAMWFEVKGVHGAITVSGDLLWEELAELSACKGAQLLINIANNDFGKHEEYIRQSFTTFNTYTIMVNAAEDAGLSSGRSRVHNDLRRPRDKYHAELVLEADGEPGLFFVREKMEATNPWFGLIKQLDQTMVPWYNYGIDIIYGAEEKPGRTLGEK